MSAWTGAKQGIQHRRGGPAEAILIAQYGEKETPSLWQPGPEHLWQIGQEMTLADQLIKQRTALRNQQQAFEQLPFQSFLGNESLQKVINLLEKEIDALEKRM
ncbi:hypothetical protein GCM10027341_55250 [Spirosoma knui]